MTIFDKIGAPQILRGLTAALAIGGTLFALSANPTAAKPQKPKTLVELFTSQGCNSCPPANALLKKYNDRDDVIALSLPVDYWDYLGWPDTFGKKQFSNRQRRYASTRGDGQVYTPQVVANGVAHAVGSRPHAVNGAIKKSYGTVSHHQIPLSITKQGNTLTISSNTADKDSFLQTDKRKVKTTLWLAMTTKKVEVAVPRGENHGKIITYYNVVRDLKPVATWTGQPLTITLPKNVSMNEKTDGCVVFLQEGTVGPIIAAAEL